MKEYEIKCDVCGAWFLISGMCRQMDRKITCSDCAYKMQTVDSAMQIQVVGDNSVKEWEEKRRIS